MASRGWERVCSRDSRGGGRFVHETPEVGESLFMRLRGWEMVCS